MRLTALSVAPDGTSEKKVLYTSLGFMGLSHILYLKQYVKGLLFALIEVILLIFLPSIIKGIINFITLGEPHPELPITQRDNSIFMLIDGIMMFVVLFVFILIYFISVRSALSSYKEYCASKHFARNADAIRDIGEKSFPVVAVSPMILLILFLVVVPLLFSAAASFTNYSTPEHIPPNNTVDWVGTENYEAMFSGSTVWSSALGKVALWTVIWAAAATFTCYAGGMFMAVVLHEAKIRIKPVFRALFILPYAVPAVVSMLVWQYLLNGSFGVVNRTLVELGIITKDTVIPWLSDVTLARFVCIAINLWAGFPYFMLLTTGSMTAISPNIFEAARIDGANKLQTFRRITAPTVLYQTMPLIIMSFAYNINNFGAIFFLTGGDPKIAESTLTSAKGTDILVTWIYNLTVNLLKYNYAAVIGVCIFVILAPFALFNFIRTRSFKEGEL